MVISTHDVMDTSFAALSNDRIIGMVIQIHNRKRSSESEFWHIRHLESQESPVEMVAGGSDVVERLGKQAELVEFDAVFPNLYKFKHS